MGDLPLDIQYSASHCAIQYSLQTTGYLFGQAGTAQCLELGPILGEVYKPQPIHDGINYESTPCMIAQTNPDNRNYITVHANDPSRWTKTDGYNAAFGMVTDWIDRVIDKLGPYPTDDGVKQVVNQILATLRGTVIFHNQYGASNEVRYLSISEAYEIFQERIATYLRIKLLNSTKTITGASYGFYTFYITHKSFIKPDSILVSTAYADKIISYSGKMEELGISYRSVTPTIYLLNNEEDLNLLKLSVNQPQIIDFAVGKRIELLKELGLHEV